MDFAQIKNVVLGVIAVVGSVAAQALGGWDAALKVLVACMAADYITGLLLAGVWKKSPKSKTGAMNSEVCFKGLCKKGMILLLVWLGVLLDQAIGAAYIRTAVVLFFIGNEGLSLLENLGLMGVPFPAALKNMLEAMREKGDQGGDSP